MATTAAIIELLKFTGHLDRPFGDTAPHPVDPLPTSLDDPSVKLGVESYQALHIGALQPLIAKHHPERSSTAVRIDGEVGPAMHELFGTARCMVPDYPDTLPVEAAVGSGSWKRCHGIGDFHKAIVSVSENNMPEHLRATHASATVWHEVLRRVQKMYDDVGLRFVFVNGQSDYLTGETINGNPQTHLSFVTSSSGWIGLAIVPNVPQSCGDSPIWLRLLAGYGSNFPLTRLISDWTSLVAHELGHNCSLGHTGGGQGVMSPYIVSNLPGRWSGDPSHPLLVQRFGGQPIPIEEPEPPEPEPEPPDGQPPYRIPGLTLRYLDTDYVAVKKASV